MSSTYKKLGIEFKPFTKDQINDSIAQIQSLRLEQILVGESEQFDWNNLIQKPELVDCINYEQIQPELDENKQQGKISTQKTLFLFNQDDPFRKNVTQFLQNQILGHFIILITFINVIAYCIPQGRISLGIEIACNVLFGIEILLKIISQGLVIEQNTYLREKWNCINFLTFFFTWFILIDNNHLSIVIFRTIRLLRVIRLPEEIQVIKIQLEAYISSFSRLGIVIVPFIFFLLFFSVIGLHFLKGLTATRCRLTPEPEDGKWEVSEEFPYMCGIYECPHHLYCGSPYDHGLEWDMHENDNEEFMWNYSRFDNLFYSLLVVFTYFCLIGWSETTYMFWKSMTTYVTASYFLLVLVFLAFIFSNLLLATFYESFIVKSSIKNSQQKVKKQQQQIETEIHQKRQQQMTDRLALMSKKRKSMKQDTVPQNTFTLYFQDQQQDNLKTKINFSNFSNELTQSIYFLVLNNLMIILCTITIVLDYDGIDKSLTDNLQIIEFVCTLYFFFELCVYILAKGIKKYLKKSVNQIDFIAIVSQVILFIVLYILNQNIIINYNRTIQVFKSIKLIRVIKFAYQSKIFYHISILTRAAIETIKKIKTMICLWLFFIIFVALVGNSLLKDYLSDHETPIHFNDFSNSVMASFNIFYNEEWHLTMYRYGRVTPISFIYHIISILLGQLIFIKLLSAVFLNEFTKQVKIQESNVKPIEYKQAALEFIYTIKQLASQNQLRSSHQLARGQTNFPGNKSLVQNVRQGILRNLRLDKRVTKIIVQEKSQLELDNLDFLKEQQLNNNNNNNNNKPSFNENDNDELLNLPNNIARSRELSIQMDQNNGSSQQQISRIKEMKTFYVFEANNVLRLNMQKIIDSKIFKVLGFMLVGLTVIRIGLSTPLVNPNTDLYKNLDLISIITTSFYCLFILLHILAHGLFGNSNSFLTQSYYNVLNFVITIIEIIVVSTSQKNHIFNFISSLRVFEFIKLGAELTHSIKCAQIALMNALVKMFQLTFFCFLLFLVYGTFAMKLLKGANYYCTEVDQEEYEIISNIDCMDYGGSWQKHRLGFDNILDSALTLFVEVTSEGWSPIMEQIWSIRGVNITPEENHNRYWAAYFQIFFFIGNTCMLNMFIGLVVSTYDESKLKAEGTFELEGNQREWFDIKKSIHHLQPKVKSKRPKASFPRLAFYLVKNSNLKKMYLIIIFINTMSLCLCYQNQEEDFNQLMGMINTICIIIFIFEILARFIAKEFQVYCKELINIIEIIGIWVCLAERIIDINGNANFYFIRCFKSLSVAIQMLRNFRIIKRFNRIERLFHSIFSVIPNALSMLYIMLVFLFIYTSLGIDLYCYLRPQQYIDDFDVHFKKLTTAMFALVRVASSELWWQLLVDALHTKSPDFACIEIDNYDDFVKYGFNGCGTLVSYVYFISFHLIFSLVLLNLFIASILGAYEEHAKQEQNAISKYQLNDVLSYWVESDPYGTGFLNYKQFWRLSSQVALCFGVSGKDLLNPANKKNFLKALNIALYEDDKSGLMGYLFHDVILALTKISVELKYGVKDLEKKNSKEPEFYHEYYKSYKKTPYNSGQMNAIIYLQNKARTLMNKKRGIKFLNIEALKQELKQQAENQ